MVKKPAMLGTGTVADAYTRVCLRLYQLSQIPKEVLEERLGYDIPPIPDFSIAGIKAQSALLHWLNSQENGFSAVTLTVLVNGIRSKLFYY